MVSVGVDKVVEAVLEDDVEGEDGLDEDSNVDPVVPEVNDVDVDDVGDDISSQVAFKSAKFLNPSTALPKFTSSLPVPAFAAPTSIDAV